MGVKEIKKERQEEKGKEIKLEINKEIETWLDENGWKRVRGSFTRGYRWQVQNSRKKNKQSRAMEEIVMGVRRECITEKDRKEIEKQKEE